MGLIRGNQCWCGVVLEARSMGCPWPVQLTPGSLTILLALAPACSAREYTPARSADRHRPEAHWRSPSILSPAVRVKGRPWLQPHMELAGWCAPARSSVRRRVHKNRVGQCQRTA